jgi:hypothetical protein
MRSSWISVRLISEQLLLLLPPLLLPLLLLLAAKLYAGPHVVRGSSVPGAQDPASVL